MKGIILLLTVVLSVAITGVHTADAVRSKGLRGVVAKVDSQHVTIGDRTYRFNKQLRVIIITRNGIHQYENTGKIGDIRVGDKVFSVVNYDEMLDIYLERY